MSLQMPVTEDTPPDMLSGAMDLNVILPNGSVIKMSVERSAPMMDLLVQITTAHKLSPGSHAIHAIGDRGVLPYKPSTPIGALDTWTVNIVPKNSSKNGRYQNQSIIKCISKPFEQTFRLQVHLPRNQLYVARISPKTQLNSILKQVCFEKNLDSAKYTLRKPDKPNEPLDLSKTLVEYKLQQLSLVLNTNRTLIGGLSSDDIMSRAPKQFSCDDSLSSGSLGGRSLSPTRSDELSDIPARRPLMVKVLPSRPVRKRRLAPKPPSQQQNTSEQTIISHSRNSSDSSGYHESSVFSDAVEFSVGMTGHGKFSPAKPPSAPSMSRSMTNLQVCGQNQNRFSEIPFMSNNIGQSKHSVSTASLVSIQSRKKKAAPMPPLANKPKLAPPQEEPEREQEAQRKSQTLPIAAKTFLSDVQDKSKTVSRIELNNNVVEPANLSPATSSLSSLSRSDVDRDLTEPASPTSSIVVGCKYLSALGLKSKRPAPKPPVRSSTIKRPAAACDSTAAPRPSPGSTADEDDELRMDDDEIDRIFGDATSGYDTPSIVTVRENNDDADVTDAVDWEYKLPDPPSAFRDDDRSPAMTVFDTVTIGDHLKDVVTTLDDEPGAAAVGHPAEANDGRAVEKIIGDRYHCFPQDSGVGSDDSSLPSSCEEKLHADEKPVAAAAAEPKESKLDNFKIVAYDEDRCARPTEIFCDESVRTWKTTQMARESNPAYKSQQTSGAVNRHRSFTADRTNFAVTVKRSTSHISLLSGNIKPSNRLAKHYVGRAYSSERLDHDHDHNDDDASLVKRSFSVDDIAEDARESSHEDYEHETTPTKIEPTLEQSSPLHSLQILKTILPQIEDHKSKENRGAHQRPSSVVDDVSPDARARQTVSSAAGAKSDDDGARSIGTVSGEPRTGHAEARYDDENVKRYSYAGPPKINVSTWNERPKRQVSIKTDRDYVIGIRQRLQLRHQQRDTDDDDGDDAGKPAAAVVSRVPIVKSVELKKPYAERLQLRTAVGPALALSEAIRAQAKLSDGCYGPHRRGGVVRKLDGGGGRRLAAMPAHVDPRETLLESIRSFGGRDNLRKIRA